LSGRCDFGGPTLFYFLPGGSDLQIVDNTITANWVNGGTGIVILVQDAGVPVTTGVHILNNRLRMTSLAAVAGIEVDVPALAQIIAHNDLYINAGADYSWAIGAVTGLIEYNQINMPTKHAGQGEIRVNSGAAQTEALVIDGNTIGGAAGSICMFFTGGGSGPISVHDNSCVGSDTGIYVVGSGPTPTTILNNHMVKVTNPYIPSTLVGTLSK
jgi:hypothetical protein